MALVAFVGLQEGVRNLLLEDGGWAYWGGMTSGGLCVNFISFCSAHFQMKAFQAPVAEQKYGKGKIKPSKIVALNDSSADIQPMNNA
jgi:hypothetical protein|tara:strand:+ start:704 stop:964 length:261 start_codon:yes stop_codon:yes gene_type:complete